MEYARLDQLPDHPDGGQASAWERLVVDGAVARPLALSAEDLAKLGRGEMVEDFNCEEGWVVPGQAWEGVPVGKILSAAGLLAEARYVSFSAGRFTAVVTLERAHDATALLALRLNGEPLTPGHGGPCRLVIAGQDCFDSVKWVDHIEVTVDQPVETAREISLRRIGKL